MRRNKNLVTGVLALVVSVVAVGLVYSAFTQTLNINGTANVMSAKWDIYFANLANATLCNYLTYTLKYTANNRDVAENDILLRGQTRNMTLKLTLDANMPASALPSEEVTIGNLGITLLYSQASGYNGANSTAVEPTYLYTAEEHTLGDTLVVNNTTVFDNFESAKSNGNPITTAHIVDGSNHIIESYVAFKANDTIYYLKGDENAYENNLDELHRAFPSCSINSSNGYNDCSGGGLDASADSVGRVSVNSASSFCGVGSDTGYSDCRTAGGSND